MIVEKLSTFVNAFFMCCSSYFSFFLTLEKMKVRHDFKIHISRCSEKAKIGKFISFHDTIFQLVAFFFLFFIDELTNRLQMQISKITNVTFLSLVSNFIM